MGSHNTLHPTRRSELQPPDSSMDRFSRERLQLGGEEGAEGRVCGLGFGPVSGVLRAAGAEFDGERVVFCAGGTGG